MITTPQNIDAIGVRIITSNCGSFRDDNISLKFFEEWKKSA